MHDKTCNYHQKLLILSCNFVTFASVEETITSVRLINEAEFGQEAPAQIVNTIQNIEDAIADNIPALIAQELPAQLEKRFVTSPIVVVNWASQMIKFDQSYKKITKNIAKVMIF